MPETGLVVALKRVLNLAQDDTPIEPEESPDATSHVFQTPYDLSPLSRISRTTVRKQILPLGSINYVDGSGKSQKVDFTSEVLDNIKKSYDAKPFDFVPLKFATEKNGHNDNVLSSVGEIKGFERNPNGGLDVIGELDEDGVKAVQKADGKLGISARFHDRYFRNHDGKDFGSAISHGLLCDRAYITGMDPWQNVELSGEEEVVNLTKEAYEEMEEQAVGQAETEGREGTEETEESDEEVSAEDEALIQEVVQEMSESDFTEGVDLATTTTDPAIKGDSVTFSRGGQTMKGAVESVDDKGIASIKLADGSMTKAPVSTLKVAPDADDSGAKKGKINMSEEDPRIMEFAERERRSEARFADMETKLLKSEVSNKAQRALEAGVPSYVVKDLCLPLWMQSSASEGGQGVGAFDLSENGVTDKEGSLSLSELADKIAAHHKGTVEFGIRGAVDGERETAGQEATRRAKEIVTDSMKNGKPISLSAARSQVWENDTELSERYREELQLA